MTDFDLNIDNYDLEDILNLFHLNYNFTEIDMKKAKIIALKTHPDRSKLNKDVFLFFMKAYKMLEAIFNYRFKKEQCSTNLKYSTETNNENKILLKSLEGKSAKEFNKLFNILFEKVKINDKDIDSGYGEWFSSNKDIDANKITSKSSMEKVFEKKKQASRALILHMEVNDMDNYFGYDLTRDKPQYYSTGVFSNLPYQDLKKAHTETVVPVTHQDYLNKPKFESVENYIRYREQNQPKMVSLIQSKNMLKERQIKNNRINTERAFRLIKRDEEISQSNKKWWGYFKQITNE